MLADVEPVEATGSDELVPCRVSGQEFLARIPADHEARPGERLRFGIAREREHLVDKESQARIRV